MTKLRKTDAEVLMRAVDSPLLVDALRAALQRVLDVEPFEDDWAALVRYAGERGEWTPDRVGRLLDREPDSLVALATELNELRTLG
jgi:hypothetical protein